jgi:hypothetical protein
MSASPRARREGQVLGSMTSSRAVRANLAASAYSLPAVVAVLLGVGAGHDHFLGAQRGIAAAVAFANEERLRVFDNQSVSGLEKNVISLQALRNYASVNGTPASTLPRRVASDMPEDRDVVAAVLKNTAR